MLACRLPAVVTVQAGVGVRMSGGQTLCHAFDKAVSASFPGGPDALLSAVVRHLPVLAFRTVWQRASAVWDMAAVFALHCSGDASAIR